MQARAISQRGPTGERRLALLYLAPSLLIFAIFVFYPLGRTFYLSTMGTDIIGRANKFVGLDNFTAMFSDPAFFKAIGTTALFVLFTVVPAILGALAVVLLLESRISGQRMFRTVFALPFAFSVATASVIFALIYNPAVGMANGILSHIGVERIGWLTEPDLALISVSITTVWMTLGYNVLVLSAGVGAIPTEVVEAARLDGATGWRLHYRITIPMLSPQLFFLIVISTIHALQSFGQIHILTKGGPDGATSTLVYWIYEKKPSATAPPTSAPPVPPRSCCWSSC
ncbi:sugar ABC transporter permease [Nonomuraea salmonea]|uniref:carbohydrate ABC transporter permease n=1 Tax=Nonomuraea salmonea TaxID=46181 RepID=UPI002FEC0809